MVTLDTNAQDNLILEEVQTYYLDGTLKSIEKIQFNRTGNIIRFSIYETNDNSLYIHNTLYDSLNRPLREESIQDKEIIDSTIYQYSLNGLKTETRWFLDHLSHWKMEKWIIKYDKNDLPINESWYDITVFQPGDTLTTLVLETKKLYDENQRIIVDSTLMGISGRSSVSMNIDGKVVEREKLNPARVTKYTYKGQFLISSETIDEYGNKQIENYIYNEIGDYVRYERIYISLDDTTSRITNYSYARRRGQKVQTSETQTTFEFSLSRTYFDKKGKTIKQESLDMEGRAISRTIYHYNDLGHLDVEIYTYLSNQRPANNLSNDPMGYRKVYLYKNIGNPY